MNEPGYVEYHTVYHKGTLAARTVVQTERFDNVPQASSFILGLQEDKAVDYIEHWAFRNGKWVMVDQIDRS